MGAMSRRKGQSYEREIHADLSAELGFIVRRNASPMARKGDPDGTEIPKWAVEAKRCEREELATWWLQTIEQAKKLGRRPVLFFRANRQKTRACMSLRDFNDALFPDDSRYAIVDFQTACYVIRESL